MNFWEWLFGFSIVAGVVFLGIKEKFAIAMWLLFLGLMTLEYIAGYSSVR